MKLKQQTVRRVQKKVKTLKDVIQNIGEKKLISTDHETLLNKKYSGVTGEILKRMSKCKQTGKGARYSPELKAFALTLQFYSTKAYNYVRKTFNLALPHNISITKWYTKIPAEPGFTEPAFKALSLKVKEAEMRRLAQKSLYH